MKLKDFNFQLFTQETNFMSEKINKENIQNALNLASELYIEAEFLLEDFSTALQKCSSFKNIKPASLERSYFKKSAHLPTYLSSFFKHDSSSLILAATISFFDRELNDQDKPIARPVPLFVLGLIKGMDHQDTKKNGIKFWLEQVLINEGGAFNFFKPKGNQADINLLNSYREYIRFECTRGDSSHYSPKRGYLWIEPLLNIKNSNDIPELNERANELFKDYKTKFN